MPNVLSPRDIVSRPDRMDETVPHTHTHKVRIPTLRGSIPELSLRKVGIGTKLKSFIIPAQSRKEYMYHFYFSLFLIIIIAICPFI